MRKTAFIILLALLLSISIALSQVTIPGWYKLEDWEIDVCSKWGGTADAQLGGGTAEGSSYMYSTTVTLQGQKSNVTVDGENRTVIEAAWYFRPIDSEQQYSITLIGSSRKTIYTGSAKPEFGDSNYYAEESSVDYDYVMIKYETGALTVPIVEK